MSVSNKFSFFHYNMRVPPQQNQSESSLQKSNNEPLNTVVEIPSTQVFDGYFLQNVVNINKHEFWYSNSSLLKTIGIECKFIQNCRKDITYSGRNIVSLESETAVALNSKRFSPIENHSFDSFYSIAVTTDKLSKTRIAFASAFCKYTLLLDKKTNEYKPSFQQDDTRCTELVKKLLALESKTDLQIIGIKMDTDPEEYETRFKIFTDQGFQLVRTGESTGIRGNEERELDYFFIKQTKKKSGMLDILFPKSLTTYKAEAHLIADLEKWNTANNLSNHKPIQLTVTIEGRPSCFFRFIYWIAGIFKSIFPGSKPKVL